MVTKSNAQRLIDLFGGVNRLAKDVGLDPATVSRFTATGKRGCHGDVPTRFFHDIMDAARKRGFPKQARLYLTSVCKECGHKITAEL